HKEIHSQQVKEHRSAVLDFTEDYLKRVCKLYSEQRAIRVKRVVDKKRLSKLEPEPNAKTRESMSSEKVSQNPSEDFEEKPVTEEYPEKIPSEIQPELGTWGDGKGEDELSPEEIQMFEQENQRLIGEMNNLFDELVVGATENIKEGNEDIRESSTQGKLRMERHSHDRCGGVQALCDAIKNNAGFRVWVLFFLVMCSFSLLFLDWYDS
ncbi:hypothetical protein MC885_001046, partial [Smutsia gigantea]